MKKIESANQTLETNRRPARALDTGREFERAVHDAACLSGGVRSALRSAPGAFLVILPSNRPRKTKTALKMAVLLLALTIVPCRCFAMMEIADVSREQAQAMGVTVRSHRNGDAGVAVWLEFKTSGKLAAFRRVELQIGEGEGRIMSAPLLAEHPSPGSIAVHFSAYPAYLGKSTLTIVVAGSNPLGGEGYRLKVKDFVDLTQYQ
jgi:hypothetical protein